MLGGLRMLPSSRSPWLTCCAWPSRDAPSSLRESNCWAGCRRETCPTGESAVTRFARLTGLSHGAVAVSESSALATPGAGSHCRGGATTMDRRSAGRSAAIMAVSARKRCSVLNEVPGDPRIWVSVSSARATSSSAPTPSGVSVTALGV